MLYPAAYRVGRTQRPHFLSLLLLLQQLLYIVNYSRDAERERKLRKDSYGPLRGSSSPFGALSRRGLIH